MNLLNTWRSHGTKLLGVGTAAIGASLAVGPQIKSLVSPHAGLLYDLYSGVANYMVFGAGLAIVKRGFTNTRRQPPGA